MNGHFQDRIAVVTGGGSGIGKAIALRFAAEGAYVYVVGRREEPLKAVIAQIEEAGGNAEAITADISSREEVESLFAHVKTKSGGVDILANSAGAMRVAKVTETSDEDFALMFDTNVKGSWLVAKSAIPLMEGRRHANIINFSSTVVQRNDTGLGVYEATKVAVNCLTKVMAKELAEKKIRVNAIAPGPVETEIFQASAFGEDSDVIHRKEVLTAQVPFGRMGTPEEVARLAVFLASPESDFISGSITTIDGAMGY